MTRKAVATMEVARKSTIERPTYDTMREAIHAALALATREDLSGDAAVDALLANGDLAENALLDAARAGLVNAVNGALNKSRTRVASPSKEDGARATILRTLGERLAESCSDVLAVIRMRGADGEVRALLQFSRGDWQHCAEDSGRQRVRWNARMQVAKRALTLLEEHKCGRTDKLPAAALEELRKRAKDAWQEDKDGWRSRQ